VKIIQDEVFQDAAAARKARYAAWGLRRGNAPRVRASNANFNGARQAG
jgi:hypothetical protein